MFDVDYKEVDLLLQVHEILATLRQELHQQIDSRDGHEDGGDKKSQNDSHEDDDYLRAAVHAYQHSLKQVFGNIAAALPPVVVTTVVETDPMPLSPQPSPTTTTTTAATSPVVIPDELVNFLYKEEEEESKTSSAPLAAARAILERVSNHVLLNATSAYSHANIKQKVRCTLFSPYCYGRCLLFLLLGILKIF
jgi:hypothetical protein